MGNPLIETATTNMAKDDSKRTPSIKSFILLLQRFKTQMGLCKYCAGYLVDDDTKNFIPLYKGEELTTKKEAGIIITID